MRGSITAASQAGQGTTFTVRLPRTAGDAEKVAAWKRLDGMVRFRSTERGLSVAVTLLRRRAAMLSRVSIPRERKPAPRRPVAAAVLFGLMLLGCGLLPHSSAQPPNAGKQAAAAVAEDGLPSLEAMQRHIPANTPPERRKQMLRMMEKYRERMKRQRALAMRQGPFAPAFPPSGFAPGGFQPFRGGVAARWPVPSRRPRR